MRWEVALAGVSAGTLGTNNFRGALRSRLLVHRAAAHTALGPPIGAVEAGNGQGGVRPIEAGEAQAEEEEEAWWLERQEGHEGAGNVRQEL